MGRRRSFRAVSAHFVPQPGGGEVEAFAANVFAAFQGRGFGGRGRRVEAEVGAEVELDHFLCFCSPALARVIYCGVGG